jgi:hypothetical protein
MEPVIKVRYKMWALLNLALILLSLLPNAQAAGCDKTPKDQVTKKHNFFSQSKSSFITEHRLKIMKVCVVK